MEFDRRENYAHYNGVTVPVTILVAKDGEIHELNTRLVDTVLYNYLVEDDEDFAQHIKTLIWLTTGINSKSFIGVYADHCYNPYTGEIVEPMNDMTEEEFREEFEKLASSKGYITPKGMMEF